MRLISGHVYRSSDGRLIRIVKMKWDSHFQGRTVVGDEPTGFYDNAGNCFGGTPETDTLVADETRQ